MSTFQGKYVEDVKLVLTASAVSHVHCVLISKPGTGKTMIARAAADIIYGDEQVFIRLDASTPPEVVKGLPDPIAAIQRGEYILLREGTAYDPKARVIIADEFGRPMDPIFDVFLDVMDRQDIDKNKSPVLWGTSNFMPTSERTEAMRDRIALWMWIPEEPINVPDVVRAQLQAIGGRLSITDHLPSILDIERIYAAEPGDKAIAAITNVIDRLKSEAEQGAHDSEGKKISGFVVNRRRMQQWGQILFRMGYYVTGDTDFDEVPAQALKCLTWAWPCTSEKEAKAWQSLVNAAITDPMTSAIAAVQKDAFLKFKDINDRTPSNQKFVQLGTALADAQRDLWQVASKLTAKKDDKGMPMVDVQTRARVEAAIADLQTAYSDYIKGKNPLGG